MDALSLPMCELHQVSDCLLRLQSQVLLDITIEF